LLDANVSAAMAECISPTIANSATLEDVPDETLREEIRAELLEAMLAQVDPDTAAILASRFEVIPLYDVIQFIQYSNTPEITDKYNQTLLTGMSVNVMDLEILTLGRPSSSLEYVSFSVASSLLRMYHPPSSF
jgi:hypothetical protein